MAEIHVERKPAGGRGPLLVLVAVLVVAALVWALFFRGGGEQPTPAPAPDSAVAVPAADTTLAAPATTPPATPAEAAPPAGEAAPPIVGDDTSGRTPAPDSAGPGEGRLGNP